jgi:hypothetical protein
MEWSDSRTVVLRDAGWRGIEPPRKDLDYPSPLFRREARFGPENTTKAIPAIPSINSKKRFQFAQKPAMYALFRFVTAAGGQEGFQVALTGDYTF